MIKDTKTAGKLNKTGAMVPPKLGYAKNIKASLLLVFAKYYQVGKIVAIKIQIKGFLLRLISQTHS